MMYRTGGLWRLVFGLVLGAVLSGCQSGASSGGELSTAPPRPPALGGQVPAPISSQPTPRPAPPGAPVPALPTPAVAMSEGSSAGDAAFGHGPGYSWVAGELYYNELEGGFWGIRYIADPAAAAADPHGGRFVLGKDPRLQSFRPGDRVRLEGRISSGQASIFMAGTIYQFDDIRRQ